MTSFIVHHLVKYSERMHRMSSPALVETDPKRPVACIGHLIALPRGVTRRASGGATTTNMQTNEDRRASVNSACASSDKRLGLRAKRTHSTQSRLEAQIVTAIMLRYIYGRFTEDRGRPQHITYDFCPVFKCFVRIGLLKKCFGMTVGAIKSFRRSIERSW
jgi:hypothetical protein